MIWEIRPGARCAAGQHPRFYIACGRGEWERPHRAGRMNIRFTAYDTARRPCAAKKTNAGALYLRDRAQRDELLRLRRRPSTAR